MIRVVDSTAAIATNVQSQGNAFHLQKIYWWSLSIYKSIRILDALFGRDPFKTSLLSKFVIYEKKYRNVFSESPTENVVQYFNISSWIHWELIGLNYLFRGISPSLVIIYWAFYKKNSEKTIISKVRKSYIVNVR